MLHRILSKKFSTLSIAKKSLSTTSYSNVYEEFFKASIEKPEEFWDERAKNVNWFEKYTQVLDHSNPPFTKW